MVATFSKHQFADWATILLLILDKLLEPADHVRIAAVCKEWNALAKEYNSTTQRCRKVLPMLMIPTESYQHRILYSVSERKVYSNLELPLSCNGKRCSGSTRAQGWLITVNRLDEHHVTITLVNAFKKAVTPIRLPPLNFNSESGFLHQYFPKVILSADPIMNPNDYLVVAIYDRALKLAFIKGGQDCWSYIERLYSFLTDAIFFKSQVYAVGQWGWILSFDVNSEQLQQKLLTHEEYPFPCNAHKGYLVESTKGDLLHVRRFLKIKDVVEKSPPLFYDDKEFWTESCKVYKVVFDEENESVLEQVELKSIGDEALFVGDNYSVSVRASDFPGCQPNSIYYSDDLVELERARMNYEGPSDTGIFNLEDQTITQHYYSPNPWYENFPQSHWISPVFNGLC